MKTLVCFLCLIINPLIADLPHRIKVIKGTKNSAITNSLKIIYNEYTSSLLNLQTDLVSSNRFEDANKVQNEYHQNLTYITLLNRGSYQFVFSPSKPLPSEASIYRETRNSKTQILLKKHIDNYINELKKAQAFYMSNRDLVSSRKATDELRLATLELSRLDAINAKSSSGILKLESPIRTTGAAISVKSGSNIKILPLKKGSHRLYDSRPLRVIENHSKDLLGWQFTSIPQRLIISLKIEVLESGFVYCFAPHYPSKSPAVKAKKIFKSDLANWGKSNEAIQGKNVHLCYKKFFEAGEFFELSGFEIQIAARSIISQ